MKSGLFDINGKEINIGDKYVNPNVENGKTYTVFFKSGCFCGGITEETCIPLGWEINDDENELITCAVDDFIKIV